ncbi:MAG: DUF4118 domain-containing protein [Terriglobales bacterium]
MKLLLKASRPLFGVVLCTAAAVVAAIVSVHHPWRVFVPLAFVFVIVLLGVRFGMAASLFGSVLTTLIFAFLLFTPTGSFRVENRTERENLAWMLMAGVVISFLLQPSQLRPGNRKRSSGD